MKSKAYYEMTASSGALYACVTPGIYDEEDVEIVDCIPPDDNHVFRRCRAKFHDHRTRLGDIITPWARSALIVSPKLMTILQKYRLMPDYQFIPTDIFDGRKKVAEYHYLYPRADWKGCGWDAYCVRKMKFERNENGEPRFRKSPPVLLRSKLEELDVLSIYDLNCVVSGIVREEIVANACENVVFNEVKVVDS